MFKKVKTFKDLVSIVEQTSQQAYAQRQSDLAAARGPISTSPLGFNSRRGTVGNLFSGTGRALSRLDPRNLASKLRSIEQQGILTTMAQAFGGIGQYLTDTSKRKLEDFSFKSQLPQGWPKEGSKFKYIPVINKLKGPDNSGITGKVVSVSQAGDSLILNINFPNTEGTPQQVGMPFAKRVVASINTKARANPNYAVTGWEVQDIVPGRGAVRDSENSAHTGRPFTYNNISGEFIYDQSLGDVSSSHVPPIIEVAELQADYGVTPTIGTTFNYKLPDGNIVPVKIMSNPTDIQKTDGTSSQAVVISLNI